MSAPLFLLLGPLLSASLISLALRRWPRAAAVAGFLSAALLAFVVAGIDSQPISSGAPLFNGEEGLILARTWTLTEGMRQILLFIYAAAAVLFLLAVLWPQGPNFVPAGLSSLAPLAFALMIDPLSYGAAALFIAIAFLAVHVQDRQAGATVAAWRYFLLSVLALPLLLISGWMLESQQLAFGGAAWRLLFLGIVLLLAGFPFHIWVRPILDEARPLAALFIFGPVQLAVLTFLWRWLQQYPDLLASTPLSSFLGWSGAATALVAGALSLNAQDPRRLLGSLVLADVGATIVCLSQGPAGIEQAWGLILFRLVSLLIAAGALQWAGRLSQDEANLTAQQRLARHPLAAILFAYGALSLIGAPLTPGFAARWSAVSIGSAASIWWGFFQLVAVGGGIVGLLRTLAPLAERLKAGPRPRLEGPAPGRRLSMAVLAVVILLALSLTFYPWPYLNLVSGLGAQF